jgi:MFS family permease
MTVVIMFLMVSITPKMVNRFGVRKNMIVGMILLSVAMLLFIMTPPSGENQNSNFLLYVLPPSLIAAIGMSLTYIPVLTTAVSNIQSNQAGLASGLVNTSYQIGSALGLAILVAWSSGHSEAMIESGITQIVAMSNGFHIAFIGAAIMSSIATVLILFSIKNKKQKAI